MDVLAGKMLMRKDGELVSADEVLANVEVIGFYFSAHWCPPCRFFTPVLAEFHTALKENNEPFEVVFISSDETKEEMMSYMTESHGDWLAVPFGEDILSQGDGSPESQGAIMKKFSVDAIPTMIIVKKDGDLITNTGCEDVQDNHETAWQTWTEGMGLTPIDSQGAEEGKDGEENENEDEKEEKEEKEEDDKDDAEEKEEKEEEDKEDAEEKEAEDVDETDEKEKENEETEEKEETGEKEETEEKEETGEADAAEAKEE